ncbi:flagellar motor switch phosphatase FliY [Bacillus wudalianchiensis]|uniref:Flagellar motor switch phosphatase FliY n=2 Tax=Pseudobacillus wudalianchiensis TaxID=1743143 RepID=A0A1B9AJ39_9BACI|nr:flagellar motor switch phosphatase FliY [Bacillus wudalianchiensis]OCA83827.1 flagellar motor switch phosphatase FliY [Bacillus wudalianchiensis]
MGDGMLSQEEIDALLRGTADTNEESDHTMEAAAASATETYVDSFEQDTLGEIGNISFGSSATALSSLLNQKVEITTPTVSVIDRQNLKDEFPHPYVAIEVEYTEGFTGATNLLVIKQSDAAIIADLMLGGDGTNPGENLGEIQLSAVQEAMNQMMGSAATSMSTIFNKRVDISPPSIGIMDLNVGKGEDALKEQELLVKISFRLTIGDLIDSNIMQLVPLEFAKGLVHELMNPSVEEAPAPEIAKEPQAQPEPAQTVNQQSTAPASPAPTQHNSQQPAQANGQAANASVQQPPVNVQPASFASFEPPPLQEHETRNLSMLLDIPLQVTVELGRTNRSVKDILDLTAGSIIELDKLAGEPVDILVNSRLVAKGEVVVIEENFGVRITDILSQSDRLRNLN